MSLTIRRELVTVLAAVWIVGFNASGLAAQFQEVQEGHNYFDVPLSQWASRSAKTFLQELDTKDLRNARTFKEVLNLIDEQLTERDGELPILVDKYAFQKEMPGVDVYELPVDLSRLPRSVTLARLLMETLRQIPAPRTTFMIRPSGYLEITTTNAAGFQGALAWSVLRLAVNPLIWFFVGLLILGGIALGINVKLAHAAEELRAD